MRFLSKHTVPGKPPTNMSVEAINPTSLLVKWELPSPSYKPVIPNKALRIFYKLQGNTTVQNIKDTNVTAGLHALDELKKFSWYTVWGKSVTSRGLGVESERFKIQTLEEGMLGGWKRLLGSLQHSVFLVSALALYLIFNDGIKRTLMSRIVRKHSLNSTSYLAVYLTFSYYFIFDRIYYTLLQNGGQNFKYVRIS